MSRRLRIAFHARAEADAAKIEAWWKVNRPAAPDLFLNELERALDAIARSPMLGASASGEQFPGARRVLMRRTRYHVYYRVTGDTVEVLAVWHGARGSGPEL